MARHSRQRSMGEMISSVVFFGFGLWLIFEAQDYVGIFPQWRIWGLRGAAALCIMAAFRFVIADFVSNFRKKKK